MCIFCWCRGLVINLEIGHHVFIFCFTMSIVKKDWEMHSSPLKHEVPVIYLGWNIEKSFLQNGSRDFERHSSNFQAYVKIIFKIIFTELLQLLKAICIVTKLARSLGRCEELSSTGEAVGGCFLNFNFFCGIKYCFNNKKNWQNCKNKIWKTKPMKSIFRLTSLLLPIEKPRYEGGVT